jgi:hypothetical protein
VLEKPIGALALTACLVGCVAIPQSRAEFVTLVQKDTFSTAHETFVVDASLESVVGVLDERSKACLNQRFVRSSGVTNEIGADTYRSGVDKPEKGRAELTVQVDKTPRGPLKQPEGGNYIVAENLSDAQGKTQVELYYATMGTDALMKSIREWTHGKKTECPDLK